MQFKKSFIFSTAVLIVVTAMAGIGYGFADDAMLGGAQGGIKKILQSSEPIGLTLDSGEKAPVNDIGFLNHPKMPAGTDNFTGLPSTVTIEDFGDPFEVLDYFMTQGPMQGNSCEDKIYKLIGYYTGWLLKFRAGICSQPPTGPTTTKINDIQVPDGLMSLLWKDAVEKADNHGCVETKKVIEQFDPQFACKDPMAMLYYLIGFPKENNGALAKAVAKDDEDTTQKWAFCNYLDNNDMVQQQDYTNTGNSANWGDLTKCDDPPTGQFLCSGQENGIPQSGLKCKDVGTKFECTKLDGTTFNVEYNSLNCNFDGQICDGKVGQPQQEKTGMVCMMSYSHPCEANKVSPLFQLDKIDDIITALCQEENQLETIINLPLFAKIKDDLAKSLYNADQPSDPVYKDCTDDPAVCDPGLSCILVSELPAPVWKLCKIACQDDAACGEGFHCELSKYCKADPVKDWEFLSDEEKAPYLEKAEKGTMIVTGPTGPVTLDLFPALDTYLADEVMSKIPDLPELPIADVRDGKDGPINTAEHLLSPYLDEGFKTSGYPINNDLNYAGTVVERNGKPDGVALVSYYFIYPHLLNIANLLPQFPIAAFLGLFPPADSNLMYYRFLDDTAEGDKLLHFAGRDLSWLENNGILDLYNNFKTICVPPVYDTSTKKILCLLSEVQKLATQQNDKCFPLYVGGNLGGVGIYTQDQMLNINNCYGNFMSVGVESPDLDGDGISDLVVVNRHHVNDDNPIVQPTPFYTYATIYEGKDADPQVEYPALLDLFRFTSAIAFEQDVADPYDTTVVDGNAVLVTVDKGVERIYKKSGGYATTLYKMSPPEGYEGYRPYQITAVDLGTPCNGMAVTWAKIDNVADTIEFADFFQLYHNKSTNKNNCVDFQLTGEFQVKPSQFADDPDHPEESVAPQIAAITYTRGDEARGIPPGLWAGDQRIYGSNEKSDMYALSYFYPLTIEMPFGTFSKTKTIDPFGVAKAVVANNYQIGVYYDQLIDKSGVSGGVKKNQAVTSSLGSVLGAPVIYQDIPLNFNFECTCEFANMISPGNAAQIFMICDLLGFTHPDSDTCIVCKSFGSKCSAGSGQIPNCYYYIVPQLYNAEVPEWALGIDTNDDKVPDYCQCYPDNDKDGIGEEPLYLTPSGPLKNLPICDNCKDGNPACTGTDQKPGWWNNSWQWPPEGTVQGDKCWNPSQTDTDGDDTGDICEGVTCKDFDKAGCFDGNGNQVSCIYGVTEDWPIPAWFNPLPDTNENGIPDYCECGRQDTDGDGMGEVKYTYAFNKDKLICDNCNPSKNLANCKGAEGKPGDWDVKYGAGTWPTPVPVLLGNCFNPTQTDTTPANSVGDICECDKDELGSPPFSGGAIICVRPDGQNLNFVNPNDFDCDDIADNCDNCKPEKIINNNGTDINLCSKENWGAGKYCEPGAGLKSECVEAIEFCYTNYQNYDQTDGDGDGIGDKCDSIPAGFNFPKIPFISTAYADDQPQYQRMTSGSQHNTESMNMMSMTSSMKMTDASRAGYAANLLFSPFYTKIGNKLSGLLDFGLNFFSGKSSSFMFSGSQKQQFQNGKIPGGKMKKPGFMGNMMNSNTMGQALPLMFEPPDPSAMVADLTQMSQQEATAGNVTVLLSKMAEDTTCGNCVEGGGTAEYYTGWTEECIELMGGDVAPENGIPDGCEVLATPNIGECSVEVGRNGKPAAGIGPPNNPYDKVIRDLNTDINAYACTKVKEERPDAQCGKYDLFSGELGNVYAICVLQKQNITGVAVDPNIVPSWVLYRLRGMTLENKNYGVSGMRPGIDMPEKLKETATRMVATLDSPPKGMAKGIVPNTSAINFAPSIVADMKQDVLPDSNASVTPVIVGGLDAIMVNLGPKPEDPLMRITVTPLPAGTALPAIVSPSASSLVTGGKAIQFEMETYAGVDGVAWAKESIPLLKNRNLDYNFVVKSAKSCIDTLADDPAKDVTYGNITECLDNYLKEQGKPWDSTAHLDMVQLFTMGESTPLLKYMVVPLSAVKYYDVGGGACSCNFGAVNPPALGNFMAYGLIAAAGTAIIIVRRRKK